MAETLAAEIAGVVVGASTLVATVVIALAVFRGTKALAKMQLQHDQRIAWMELDFHALENDALLEVVDKLLHPDDIDATLPERRKRWACYLLRNPLESMYLGVRAGLADCEATSMASVRASLGALVRDDVFMKMIDTYTPDPAFVELCHDLRNDYERQAVSAAAGSPQPT